MSLPHSATPPPRILIEDPWPLVDCGRYPSKACVGDRVEVSALILRDGAAALGAIVRYRGPEDPVWSEAPMRRAERDEDRWQGWFLVDAEGPWRWSIEAWTDAEVTWRDELERRIAAGQQDLSSEFAEGALLLRAAAARAGGDDQRRLASAAALLEDPSREHG